jgi:phage recombination protein Bet
MNALVKTENTALAAITEAELMEVLQSSLYPGARLESIKMVLGYCKASGLDPMQKPVHIVPMWDAKAGQMRDVVMPGVGLYRTQAARTGTFAGQTEPEFGPMVDEVIGGLRIVYPEWARVTVKKLMRNGEVAEFTAREYWIENYAVKGGKEKSIAPNAMWAKRPRGQIAKCAAAQALRLAFPEMGAQATAEEMEGKTLHDDAPPAAPRHPAASDEQVQAAEAAAAQGVQAYQEFWSAAGADNRKALAGHHARLKDVATAADAARTVEAEPADQPVHEGAE